MKKIIFISLALYMMVTGCTWPGILGAKGNVYVTKPNDVANNPAIDRTIVLSFWCFPAVNDSPPKLVFDDTKVMESDGELINFSWKFYQIVWTPVLGTQHLSPDPGIVVFSDGNWPLIGYDVAPTGLKFRRCCQSPLKHIREFRLQMIPVTHPLSIDSNMKKDYELLIQNSKQFEKHIDENQSLTSDDKKMIHDGLMNLKQIL